VLRAAVKEAGTHAPSEAADAKRPSGMVAERMAERVGQAILQGVGRAFKEAYAEDSVNQGAAEYRRQLEVKAHFGKGE